MAFRMSRHADGPNPVLFQEAGFKNLHRIADLAGRFCNITCDNENLGYAGFSGQPSEKIIKNRDARDAAGDDVRHRLHTLLAQPHRKFDSVAQVGARCMRDVNTRAGGHKVGESRDPPSLQYGRLEGVVSNEVLDGNRVYYGTCFSSRFSQRLFSWQMYSIISPFGFQ